MTILPKGILDDLQDRCREMRTWLRTTAPYTTIEQCHLDEGCAEYAYWQHGYQTALQDVLDRVKHLPDHGTSGRSTH
jgi:hypothetical protein